MKPRDRPDYWPITNTSHAHAPTPLSVSSDRRPHTGQTPEPSHAKSARVARRTRSVALIEVNNEANHFAVGSPFVAGAGTLWDAAHQAGDGAGGTAVVCDFRLAILFDREQTLISVGTVDKGFIRNIVRVLARRALLHGSAPEGIRDRRPRRIERHGVAQDGRSPGRPTSGQAVACLTSHGRADAFSEPSRRRCLR